ncbi:MAG: caspase family protein, partial [Gammaproteobacteria bacterium]
RSFRGGSRGLARVEGPKGTIIGFATSPGSTAADGDGANGLYTKHLLSNMREPGISIEQVFKQVLQGVNEETGGQQIPWTESSFTGNFSFAP